MGSATACHLARRGQRVLGLDQFAPPHRMGSSHGQTRIIREAYFEHPAYVPLVQRAYELWVALEKDTGRRLFHQTGGLMIGPADGVLVSGTRRSAEQHQLPHELLTAEQIRKRFPAFAPDEGMSGVWEPRAGILFPEQCVQAHLAMAQKAGASLQTDEPVLKWKTCSQGIEVQTSKATYAAEHLILSAGRWLGTLLPELKLPLSVERVPVFWFEADQPAMFEPDRCPVHLWEHAPGRFFYGFPELGAGVKVARHDGDRVDGQEIDWNVTNEEARAIFQLVTDYLPGLSDKLREATVCMYTNTPDGHFLIDRHPAEARVWLLSPCSGHGFKFSCVIGEIISRAVLGENLHFDLTLFRNRFRPCP